MNKIKQSIKDLPLICKIFFGISGFWFLLCFVLLIYSTFPNLDNLFASAEDKTYLAYIEKGNDYYQEDNYELSMEEFDKALAIHNDDPYLYSLRAENYKVNKKYEKAIEEAKKGIKCLENKSVYYSIKGYYKFGSNKDIASYLYLYWAKSAMKLKQYEEAIEAWTGVIDNSKYTYSTSAYFKRGRCYYRIGDIEAALKDFKKHKETIYQYMDDKNKNGDYADTYNQYSQKDIEKIDKWIKKCEDKLGIKNTIKTNNEEGTVLPPQADED